MFDYITCNAPLPGDPPKFAREPGHRFQTRSLDCSMAQYAITDDGRLVQANAGIFQDDRPTSREIDYHGILDFYDGNARAASRGHWFTPGGEDYDWVTYRAKFTDGRLAGITEVERTREAALPIERIREFEGRVSD